ncbi:HNH endonuclease signature motif containing protein [Gryllotalpicola ginsengisoli]|uniref:HNH endonuclease signature motif containing protein n=1 Tax=Gryllotalpicola ginsengisoli TaxID=444608 RepID=UPI00138AF571|nr:HNH endonuclease signature motif containing protein [Gryllotalpicola ginsengisoli]
MSSEHVFDSAVDASDMIELDFVLKDLCADRLRRVQALDAQIAQLQAQRQIELWHVGDDALEKARIDAEDALATGADVSEQRCRELRWRAAAMEVAAATRVSPRTAAAQLGGAWELIEHCEVALAALQSGEISLGHAQAIVRETSDLDDAAREAVQREAMPWARKLSVGQFQHRLRLIADTVQSQPLPDRHERAVAARHVRVEGARDGMAWLTAYLDATDAAVIATGMRNAAHEAQAHGDTRTLRQLEADVLVEVLAHGTVTIGAVTGGAGAGTAENADEGAAPVIAAGGSATCATIAARAPISVSVLIPAATLAGGDAPASISGIGMIDPVKARELVARAPSLRRILTDPITGAIVDFDRKTYRVPAELKRIVQLRDRHCRAPGCNVPAEQCEVDHTIAYARGGPTRLGNLACLCANHHHVKHEAGWGLMQYAGGILEWISPTGRHYRTEPEIPIAPSPPHSARAADDDAVDDDAPF